MLYVSLQPQPWFYTSIRYYYFDDVHESVRKNCFKFFEKPFKVVSFFNTFTIPEVFLRDDMFQYIESMLKIYRQYKDRIPFMHYNYARSRDKIIQKLVEVHPILPVAFFGVIEKFIQFLKEEYDLPEKHVKVSLSSRGFGILLSFPIHSTLRKFCERVFRYKPTYDAWIFFIHVNTDLKKIQQNLLGINQSQFEYAYVKVYSDGVSHFSVGSTKNTISFRNRYFYASINKCDVSEFIDFCKTYSTSYKSFDEWFYDIANISNHNVFRHSRFDDTYSQFIFWRASQRIPDILTHLGLVS